MDLETNKKSRLKVFLENPSKALWSLAIPIMFGMGIQTFYNLIDILFIGRLGGDADVGLVVRSVARRGGERFARRWSRERRWCGSGGASFRRGAEGGRGRWS